MHLLFDAVHRVNSSSFDAVHPVKIAASGPQRPRPHFPNAQPEVFSCYYCSIPAAGTVYILSRLLLYLLFNRKSKIAFYFFFLRFRYSNIFLGEVPIAGARNSQNFTVTLLLKAAGIRKSKIARH